MPERERERLKRLSELESKDMPTTHPPFIYQRDFLKAHWAAQPQVTLTLGLRNQLDQELACLETDDQWCRALFG